MSTFRNDWQYRQAHYFRFISLTEKYQRSFVDDSGFKFRFFFCRLFVNLVLTNKFNVSLESWYQSEECLTLSYKREEVLLNACFTGFLSPFCWVWQMWLFHYLLIHSKSLINLIKCLSVSSTSSLTCYRHAFKISRG